MSSYTKVGADADAADCTNCWSRLVKDFRKTYIVPGTKISNAQCAVLQAAAAVITFVVSPVSCSR